MKMRHPLRVQVSSPCLFATASSKATFSLLTRVTLAVHLVCDISAALGHSLLSIVTGNTANTFGLTLP